MSNQSKNGVYILGIFCCFHDSSACLLRDGKLVAMAEEERFNRQKHTYVIPLKAIEYCLKKGGIDFSDVDAISYGFKPGKFVLNQICSGLKNLPTSFNLLRQNASYMSLRTKMYSMFNIRKCLRDHFKTEPAKIHYVDHHTAHAYSSFFVSPFESAAILVVDGFGESYATSFGLGRADEIEFLHHVPFPNSIGVYYGAVTQYLGFRPHSDEYKVMGMAAYGQNKYVDLFTDVLSLTDGFNFKLNTSYIDFYTHGVTKWFSDKMVKVLGPARNYSDPYTQKHFDIAKSAQTQLENVMVPLGKRLQEKTLSKNLCVIGGVAQNVLMNRCLLNGCGFENIYITPVAYDGGVSMGSAFAVYHKHFNGKRKFVLNKADWGPGYDDKECLIALNKRGLSTKKNVVNVTDHIAELLSKGKIVGYFNGGMEIGPRALGYRSILADPTDSNMKDVLNARIKKREFFRPFSPIVTLEDRNKYFDLDVESPFMALTGMVKNPDMIPAVTHEDGTARIQTVTSDGNPHIHALLKSFAKLKGVPILLNTSFNENEPIVCTPDEAIDCFLRTHMDVLVFNNELVVEK